MIASVFCWVSLALLVAAFWDLKFRTDKRRDRFVRELRSVYDRYYDGQQAFGFDGHNWTHERKAGRYEAPWNAVTSAVERQNTVNWSTKDHSIIVPKRAVASVATSDGRVCHEERTLALLRTLALGPLDNALSFRLGLVDYVLIEVPSLWRNHPFLMAEAHLGGVLWLVMIANGTYNTVGPGVVVGWTVVGLLLFLIISAQFWYFVAKYLTAPAELRTPWESGFSERGVRTSGSEIELFSAWLTFRKFRETNRAFLLYFGPNSYHIYPKRSLSSEQQTKLRDLLKTSVAAEN